MSSASNLQLTLAIIKPHAIRHRNAIVRRIENAGFRVLQVRKFWWLLNRFPFTLPCAMFRNVVLNWLWNKLRNFCVVMAAKLQRRLKIWVQGQWLFCACREKMQSNHGSSWWDRKIARWHEKVLPRASVRFTATLKITRWTRFMGQRQNVTSGMSCVFSSPTVRRT